MLPVRISDLLDAAASAASWADYEQPLFDWLENAVGFDVGFCLREGEIGPHAPGLDARVRRETAGRFDAYSREYAPLRRKALETGGAANDLEFFGKTALERTLTYREVIRPHRGRSSLLVFVGGTSAPRALLVLGRTGSNFRESDRQQLVAARSLLTVCERAVGSRQVSEAGPPLSPRERELISTCGSVTRIARSPRPAARPFARFAISSAICSTSSKCRPARKPSLAVSSSG